MSKHMNFIDILTAVNFRPGYRFARAAKGATEWYEWRNTLDGVLLCAGSFTGNGNVARYYACPMPNEHDREAKDWIVLQDLNTGKVPEL